jgi:predicted dehydrogenase
MHNVLVLGAGWVARQHIAAFLKRADCRIAAVCSRTPENMRKLADELGLRDIAFYTDTAQALRHSGIDIVSVCTPQHLHCRQVIDAAEAGKHIVIEKPAATTPADLYQMLEAVRANGVKTVVSFVLRWNPLLITLKKMLVDGVFGRPYYIEVDYMSYNGSWWGGWNDARTVKQGVSAALVAGCHAIDAARWLGTAEANKAADVDEVFAICGGFRKGKTREYNPLNNTWLENAPPMEYDGLEVLLMKLAGGAAAKVCVNAEGVMPYRFPIRIFGERGTAVDNRIWSEYFPMQNDWITVPAVLPESGDVSHHPFQGEIDHFVECIAQNVESHCNLADAVKSHEAVFAALQCYQDNKPVKLGENRRL